MSSTLPVRIVRWQDEPKLDEAVRRLDEQSFSSGTRINAAEELARPFTRGWVARIDASGHIAGYLLTWHVADELHVLNIATDRALRRCGVARTLLNHAMDYAHAHRVRLLLLEVRRSNHPAISLYRRFGFFISGLRPRYYTDNQEDAVEMMLTLDPDTGRVIPGVDEIPWSD